MKNKPFPDILKRTWWNWRCFKIEKRRELRRMLEADDMLMRGSAYLPRDAYNLSCRIRADMSRLSEMLSYKEWGR